MEEETAVDLIFCGAQGRERANPPRARSLALRTTRLPFLEAVLLALVEQVRLGASQIDYLRTSVSLTRHPKSQPKKGSVGTGYS